MNILEYNPVKNSLKFTYAISVMCYILITLSNNQVLTFQDHSEIIVDILWLLAAIISRYDEYKICLCYCNEWGIK